MDTNFVSKLFDTVAHELKHCKLEEPCSNTHNRTFYLKKRNLLIMLLTRLDTNEFHNALKLLYEHCKKDLSTDEPLKFNRKSIIENGLLKNPSFIKQFGSLNTNAHTHNKVNLDFNHKYHI